MFQVSLNVYLIADNLNFDSTCIFSYLFYYRYIDVSFDLAFVFVHSAAAYEV
jgi:hypothetical protein